MAAGLVTVHSLSKGGLQLHLAGSTTFLVTWGRQEREAQAQTESTEKMIPLSPDVRKGDDRWKEKE